MSQCHEDKRAVLIVDGNNISWRASFVIGQERFLEVGGDMNTDMLSTMLNKRMNDMGEHDGYRDVIPLLTFDIGYQRINNDSIVNRRRLLESYKANRKDDHSDPDVTAMNHLREEWMRSWKTRLCNDGIVVIEHPCVEADDIMAYAADILSGETDSSIDVAIWTADKDLMQCVRDDPESRVIMYRRRTITVNGKKTSEERLVDSNEVMMEKGVPPDKVRMQLALAGDSADDYAGIKGYGGKLGVRLVNASDSIEDLTQQINENLASRKNPPSDEEVEDIDATLMRNWTLAGCGRDWMPSTAQVGVELGVEHILSSL